MTENLQNKDGSEHIIYDFHSARREYVRPVVQTDTERFLLMQRSVNEERVCRMPGTL